MMIPGSSVRLPQLIVNAVALIQALLVGRRKQASFVGLRYVSFRRTRSHIQTQSNPITSWKTAVWNTDSSPLCWCEVFCIDPTIYTKTLFSPPRSPTPIGISHWFSEQCVSQGTRHPHASLLAYHKS